MPLLEFIRAAQGKLQGSIEDAAAAALAMLRIGAVPARRCGPEGAVPLDGRYEHWNGLLYPAAWHVANIHDDGTVSFDVSEGSAALRRAQQHAIEVRHTIEVERAGALRCLQDTVTRTRRRERASRTDVAPSGHKPRDPDAAYREHGDRWIAEHGRYPSQKEDEDWCREVSLLPAREQSRALRKKHVPEDVRKGGKDKNLAKKT
jgi:hypothetical protein